MRPQDAAVRDQVARVLWDLRRAAPAASQPLAVAAWDLPGEPVPVAEGVAAAAAGRFEPVTLPHAWGRPWGTTWFRVRGTVPRDWSGRPVEALIDLGFGDFMVGFHVEGLVVRPDGQVLHGLHPRRRAVIVAAPARGGETVDLLVEAAANPAVTSFGGRAAEPDPGDLLYELRTASLVVPRSDVRALVHDLEALDAVLALGRSAGADDGRLEEVAAAVASSIDMLGGPEAPAEQAVAAARAALAPALAVTAAPDAPTLALVGHAHLDTAWLWPVRETVRKAVRTFSNVLDLMDRDPHLVFAGTQALHHAWVRDLQPALWARVVLRAREGRWVPVCGMWVESDTLLASGESLARQLVHGQRFYASELGRTATTGWLPDCFGYAPVLPQLLRQAGIDSFVTQKLSWNDTNRFPHATFWWEGLDGSRVLAHFPTVDTYNAELSADDLVRTARPSAAGDPVPVTLVPFGFGDGGGGPTGQMLARADRLADLGGAPRAVHTDPDAFFAGLPRDHLPTWRGELYLETHRGVWTSQRETKLGDARTGEALLDAERWCATATWQRGAAYPYDELDALWKRHLLLEFHDILPGSSIGRVHREAEAEHADVLVAALGLRDAAVALLGASHVAEAAPDRWEPARRPVLDDGVLRVEFDDDGHPVSVRDLRAGRELLPQDGRLGLLALHPDRPAMFDAWNLDRSYLDERTDLLAADGVWSAGPSVRVKRTFGTSSARLTWTLGDGRLDLVLDVDWQEDEHVLKLVVPLDLRAPHHTAGVQGGLVERALHTNTTWEQARYEQWFHGYLHVAEGGYGVALVAADVHGYDATSCVRDEGGTTTTLRPTLLRAPVFPDPVADRGRHSFAFSLLAGTTLAVATDEAVAARRALVPAAAVAPAVRPVVVVSGDGVVADAVKLADDGSGDLVVRLHEALGGRTQARFDVAGPVASAALVDLLERPGGTGAIVAARGQVRLPLGPFEIATVRLRRGAITP